MAQPRGSAGHTAGEAAEAAAERLARKDFSVSYYTIYLMKNQADFPLFAISLQIAQRCFSGGSAADRLLQESGKFIPRQAVAAGPDGTVRED